jgi:glutamine amidotransferase
MQLLATYGTEGAEATSERRVVGLDLIPGTVMHLPELGCELRVPHVGWNSIDPVSSSSGLFKGIPAKTDFYFVHSYTFVTDNASDVIATAEYGIKITAAVQRENVWGTQFHPEKSSRAGFTVLRNFIEACGC